MNKEYYTCAITGYRPDKFAFGYDESDVLCVKIKERLYNIIRRLCRSGLFAEFRVGGAQGTDCWAAEAVIKLREEYPDILLHSILPFDGYMDLWPDNAKARQKNIIDNSDILEYASSSYNEKVYKLRNQRLVEDSKMLVAVGGRDNGQSGTGQTIRMAKRAGVEYFYFINFLSGEGEWLFNDSHIG